MGHAERTGVTVVTIGILFSALLCQIDRARGGTVRIVYNIIIFWNIFSESAVLGFLKEGTCRLPRRALSFVSTL
jgi:hypothetical protein